MHSASISAAVILVFSFAGPAHGGGKLHRPGRTPAYQIGEAGWYGKSHQGRKTASGEPFDMYQLTAAHRDLPLGTLVRVTNLANRKSVVVRINDRGPAGAGRIVDLSYAASKQLGMLNRGVTRVRLDLSSIEKFASAD